MVKALILTGFGINCEEETAAAYKLAGAEATIVHINEILQKGHSIHDYDILNFPGGFSFGDDLSSGKVMANKIKFKQLPSKRVLLDEIKDFIDSGKLVLGICNGFQILVKLGLLPNVQGKFEQEVTLTNNQSAKFEDRWVYLKNNPKSTSTFTKGMELTEMPVRHGEGKLIIGNEKIKMAILEQGLNCLTYTDSSGAATANYPENPNGSELNCAALSDPSGQVFGLMPHPEAFLSLYNHPNWGQLKRQHPNINEDGQGLEFFKNIVETVLAQKSQKMGNQKAVSNV